MDIVDDLCALMRADAIASCGRDDKENRIALVAKDLKEDGTPLCIKDLKVSGDDLVRIGIEEKDRGKVLNALWEDTVMNPALNDRNKALDYIERMNKNSKKGRKNDGNLRVACNMRLVVACVACDVRPNAQKARWR